MTVIMSVEGVLRKDDKTPIPEGIKLFRTLLTNYRVVLSTEAPAKEINHWLKSNFIFEYANVYCSEDAHVSMPIRMRHIKLAQTEGRAELFVDADPGMCAEALAMGVPAILFATPKYFKVNRDIRPWEVLAEEQARQKMVVAELYSDLSDSDLARWE